MYSQVESINRQSTRYVIRVTGGSMICFAWSGFPQYAARCVGAFVDQTGIDCAVVATRPRVPVKGMEALCRCPIHWVSANDTIDVISALGVMPEHLIVSGWGIQAFNKLCTQVRSGGGRVYAMVDNNYGVSFREILKMLRFRLLLKRKYDGFLVPGNSSVQLLRFYGVCCERIFKGMYSADASIFRKSMAGK